MFQICAKNILYHYDENREALRLLKNAGSLVKKDNIVTIPSYIVENVIRSAPSRVVLSNQDGRRVIFLEGFRYYFGAGPQ